MRGFITLLGTKARRMFNHFLRTPIGTTNDWGNLTAHTPTNDWGDLTAAGTLIDWED